MEEFVKNIGLLLGTVGYPLLQKLETKTIVDHEDPLFMIQNKDGTAKGTARMTNEGFIVYRGSIINGKQSPKVSERNERLVAKLSAEGIIEKNGDGYLFVRDHSFTTPSAAGDLILGYSENGWMMWKTADGRTLDELYRQGL